MAAHPVAPAALALPVVRTLGDALQNIGVAGSDYTLSPNLTRMFRSQFKDEDDGDAAVERARLAKEIYDNIGANGPPPAYAVLYSIRDLDARMAAYQEGRIAMRDRIRTAVGTRLTLPTPHQLRTIFRRERRRLAAIEVVQRGLYNHFSMPAVITALHAALAQGRTVDEWFEDQHERVEKLACNNFYGLDEDAAIAVGRVYGPGDAHNWGLNCGWLLGIIHRNVPVISLSQVTPINELRAHPGLAPDPNPSAFALEMATLMTAGYTLSYTHVTRQISYRPTHRPTVRLDMNGVAQGLLQTRQNQIQIYQEVRNHINLGNDIVNWTPPTIVAQNGANLAQLVATNAVHDLRAASHPHVRTADLIIVAGRTNPATLLAAVANPNADAATLSAVVANIHYTAESDTAVARNPQTLAADLSIIAGRTLLTTDLHAIALHPRSLPISDSAVVRNDLTLREDLRIIAGRTSLTADLHTIVAHPNHYSASDMAVVGNARTLSADLVTIAYRSVPMLLERILSHPNCDENVKAAIAATPAHRNMAASAIAQLLPKKEGVTNRR
jgi:hypothetical protein